MGDAAHAMVPFYGQVKMIQNVSIIKKYEVLLIKQSFEKKIVNKILWFCFGMVALIILPITNEGYHVKKNKNSIRKGC